MTCAYKIAKMAAYGTMLLDARVEDGRWPGGGTFSVERSTYRGTTWAFLLVRNEEETCRGLRTLLSDLDVAELPVDFLLSQVSHAFAEVESEDPHPKAPPGDVGEGDRR